MTGYDLMEEYEMFAGQEWEEKDAIEVLNELGFVANAENVWELLEDELL